MGTPCKTAAGHAELAARNRQLSQRHRTLLFLVDGQRSVAEVMRLGALAGVPRAYLDELIALGLVVLGVPTPAARMVMPLPTLVDADLHGFDDDGPGVATGHRVTDGVRQADRVAAGPRWPAVFSSQEDSIGFGQAAGETELADLALEDPALDQARRLILQALRSTALVAGAVTMLRVRRSRNRSQLRALLPEVQARLSRPRHLADARLVIQRVEALLSL